MNQQQKNYTMKRVSEIEKRKISEAEAATLSKGVTFTNSQKIQALKNGEFTVTEPGSIYTSWATCVSFNGETPKKVALEERNKLVSKIQEEATRIRDELMIGDCDEALSMLKEFEKSS